MPRISRRISRSGIYHVMTRAFPDKLLFYNNKDKEKMLLIIKDLQIEENFKVYAYCLMNTHTHFLIDANGANLSTIMKKLNLRYGNYLRRKGKIKGPVFRDRFNSKPVENLSYLIQVSKYIHRNPIDIKKYRSAPEKYEFSSLSLYLGQKKNKLNICDEEYVMSFFANSKKRAIQKYYNSIFNITEENLREAEMCNEKSEYRSERILPYRDYKDIELRKFICSRFNISNFELSLKYYEKNKIARAIYVVFLNRFAAKNRREICGIMGGITQSTVSRLCRKGIELLEKDYMNILDEFTCDEVQRNS